MRKPISFLLLAAAAILVTAGCSTLFQRTGGELRATDGAGQTLTIPATVVDGMAVDGAITAEEIAQAVTAALAGNPNFNPADIVEIEPIPEVVSLSPDAEAITAAVRLLPIPYADAAAMALSGALGIAALWQRKRKVTAENVSASLVKGIDTFRDVLDQTPSGAAIDAELTKRLSDAQLAAGTEVLASIQALLARYATPTKPTGGISLQS